MVSLTCLLATLLRSLLGARACPRLVQRGALLYHDKGIMRVHRQTLRVAERTPQAKESVNNNAMQKLALFAPCLG